MSVNDTGPEDGMRSNELEANSEGFTLTRCSGPNCGAPIIFTETLAAKRQVLDPEPTADGTIFIEDRGRGRLIAHVFSGKHLESQRQRGVSLYKAHWATCPDAERFRGRG